MEMDFLLIMPSLSSSSTSEKDDKKMLLPSSTSTRTSRSVRRSVTRMLSLAFLLMIIAAAPSISSALHTRDPTRPEPRQTLFGSSFEDSSSVPLDFQTTSASVSPVKLQTVTSFPSSSGESSTVELIINDNNKVTTEQPNPDRGNNVFIPPTGTGWKEQMMRHDPSSSIEMVEDEGSDFPSSPPDKEYKSVIDLEKYNNGDDNETRPGTKENLQEEGSNHQPVVFVGGPGYVPPNNLLRPRPPEVHQSPPSSSWENSPESRYPVNSYYQSPWDRNYRNPFNMTRVQHIEAECQDDYMKIRVAFNGSFHGLIYSSGYSYDPDCVYINGTGRDGYEYLIKLNRCGTLGASNHVEGRKEPSKNFMWNTVTVQYNPMIEEEWDEHFKVTCEYGYDFWKTVTFPFLDVEVATGNPVVFTLTPPECYMEIRYGFGTSGTRVGGPVRVGDPLTLVIYMRSQYDGFDIVVSDCYAHNGATKRIQLIDHYGCPVDSKLMSPFRGTWSHTGVYETQVYAYLKTFRFTGSPALYIECDVRMCHGQCPSQPCYWRNVKNVRKRRSISDDTGTGIEGYEEKNSTLSENLSLFQALRVLQEDEEPESRRTEFSNNPEHDSVCLRSGTFTAMIGLSTLILIILSISTMIMCFRARRVKSLIDDPLADVTNIIRPYTTASHHHSNSSHNRLRWLGSSSSPSTHSSASSSSSSVNSCSKR